MRAVGGPVLGDKVPGHVAAQTVGREQAYGGELLLAAGELEHSALGQESVREEVTYPVVGGELDLREKLHGEKLVVGFLQLLLDLGGLGIVTYQGYAPLPLKDVDLVASTSRPHALYRPVESPSEPGGEPPIDLARNSGYVVVEEVATV